MYSTVCGTSARFTAVTNKVIRIEYDPLGVFEDRQSLSFLYRNRSAPTTFHASTDSKFCNITTSAIALSFRFGVVAAPACNATLYPNADVGCGSGGKYTCAGARAQPQPTSALSVAQCCAACNALTTCGAFVSHASTSSTATGDCYLMKTGGSFVTGTRPSHFIVGAKTPHFAPSPSPPSPPAPAPSAATAFFKAHDLTVVSIAPAAAAAAAAPRTAMSWSWRAGDDDDGNLQGTLRAEADGNKHADLAGCCDNPDGASTGNWDPKYPIETGILSRHGWALVDDNKESSVLVDWAVDSTDIVDVWPLPLAEQRTSDDGSTVADWYLFGCGRDYRGCMADFSTVTGNIALPPLNGLGVWWSRHWGDESGNAAMVDDPRVGVMSEHAIVSEVLEGYASRNLPLHIMVMDMEWHEMAPSPSCVGFEGKAKWGGYTWNTSLFSDPLAFATMLHTRNISTLGKTPRLGGPLPIEFSLNFHPDSGVDNCQANYGAFGKALGLPTSTKKKEILPDLDGAMSYNRTYVDAYFKFMIDPTFVDHAWTDTPKATTWSNWLYVRDARATKTTTTTTTKTKKKKKRRTINFSRYGGIGDHRKPTGFSGDSKRKWDTLAYEVWFTPRASNVGFGWWSHDIGGFAGDVVDTDWHTETPELFLRWLQFAAYSPIFRTHCRYCDQRVWSWSKYDLPAPSPSWETMMSATMHRRNALVPYIYTHARRLTWAKGESLLVPMYWEPNSALTAEAYAVATQQQYWFGRDYIVAPITSESTAGGALTAGVPSRSNNNVSSKSFWLPATNDTWFALESMESLGVGPRRLDPRTYDLGTTPVLVRGGSVVPTRNVDSTYRALADPLIWEVEHTGAISGAGECYEDDGVSLAFENNDAYGLTTSLSFNVVAGSRNFPSTSAKAKALTIHITASGSGFPEMPASREQRVLLLGANKLPVSASCGGSALPVTPGGKSPAKGVAGVWVDSATGWCVLSCGSINSDAAHAIRVMW